MEKKYIETAREVLSSYGFGQGVDLQHLLAVLIGPKATPELCGRLSAKGIQDLADLTEHELCREGLTLTQAQRVMAGFQVGRKWSFVSDEQRFTVRSPEDAYNYLRTKIAYEKQEVFYVLYLNTKNQVIYERAVFKGSLNASLVHPRETYRFAVQHSAASIVCGHNHPSHDPSPSREDIDITKRLAECGKLMGIELLDHLVVCQEKYVSLKEKGCL
ncbi:JAB domain-containing protein [Domibacillus robiginosus]|uniref:JAB domain-containing protein n=1 Tax=Domibacillus robiginosus TaxID=1071054 RepID=UPI00067C902D|nr:DNA repair protein RadC [Domibacillus robiginosus]